jgi:hypothetical protein
VKQQSIAQKVFDPLKLEAMTEPLSVRVEKMKGNVRTPIPLPPGADGSQQGTNWSKSDVNGLEQWLVTDWSGGGHYLITVSDSTLPTPTKMDWAVFYAPVEYPEKIPPTLSAAAQPERAAPTPAPQVRPMSNITYPAAFPNGLPAVQAQPAPVAPAPAPQAYYAPPAYAPPAPSWRDRVAEAPANVSANAAAEAERRRLEEQVREMQAQVARAREEQIQAQHKAELERAEQRMRAEQSALREQFDGLKSTIAQLAQTLTANATAKPSGPDPEVLALREEIRAQRERAEQERRDREMRDLIQRQQDDTRRQAEQFQLQLAQLQNKAPDPLLQFMQENARQQADATKEQARSQQAQMERLQSFMMNPRDIMAMSRESSNGIDQVTRQITGAYQDILQMQRQAVEMTLQLASPSEGIGTVVDKNLDRLAGLADRYFGNKTREAVEAQRSQAQIASAQATAMQAQATAMQVQAGLGGASAPAAPVEIAASPTPELAAPAGPQVPRNLGKTDAEWFGPIMSQVEQLRQGVATYLESIQLDPVRVDEDGDPEGISSAGAAHSVMMAIGVVVERKLPIPAMQELILTGRVVDFVNVLLPDAPAPFRDEVIDLLKQALAGESAEDEDEDEDEDEEPAPAPTPARTSKAAAVEVLPKNGARPRA